MKQQFIFAILALAINLSFAQYIGIGTSIPTAKLTIQSGGSTLATSACIVKNSLNYNLFQVYDNGLVYVGMPNSGLSTYLVVDAGTKAGLPFIGGNEIMLVGGGNASSGNNTYIVMGRTAATNGVFYLEPFNGGGALPGRMAIGGTPTALPSLIGIGTYDPRTALQVARGDVYISDIARGVIMKSPNGNCWRLTVSNAGAPVLTNIVCP